MRNCQAPNCGVDISHRKAWAKYCSPTCGDRSRPDRSEYKRQKAAEWREANPERNAANVAKWRSENREKMLAGIARWQRANPDTVNLIQQNRRARKREAATFVFTAKEWRRLVNRFGGCCAYCGERSDDLQIEHVVPLARGGYNGAGNYLPACPPCNRSKHDRFLIEWRYRRVRP